MKKILLVAIATLGMSSFGFAQEIQWGVKAGVDMANIKVKNMGSKSETGFFLGATASFGIAEKFKLQPEVLYVNLPEIKATKLKTSHINIPVFVKYEVAEKINIMAGPSFNYFMDLDKDKFKVGVDFGAAYDVTENIDINAKYAVGTGDVSVSGIFIGAGYKF